MCSLPSVYNMSGLKFATFLVCLAVIPVFSAVSETKPWWLWHNIDSNPTDSAQNGRNGLARSESGLRLPNQTAPYLYEISITTNLHSGDLQFSAVTRISIDVLEATSTIVLNQLLLNVNTITLNAVDSDVNIPVTWQISGFLETLTIETAQALTVGTQYVIEVSYTANMQPFRQGFYMSHYTNENGENVHLGATHFEPINARLVYPSYDEPRFRAAFDLVINHDQSLHAISNMPVNSAVTEDGRTETTFDRSPPMPTYLLAFVVSSLENTSNSEDLAVGQIPHRVFAEPSEVSSTDFSLNTGDQVLEEFGRLFGIEYTLPKLDQVAIPVNFESAMENWGIVLYGHNLLLVRPWTNVLSTEVVGLTVAHELAHQWFGNLVTPEWWTFLWLSEGFATYYEYIGIDFVYPEWRMRDLFTVEVWHWTARRDLGNYRAMNRYVEGYFEIRSNFDFITYQKASCVIRMVVNALGENEALQGISKYFNDNINGVVNPDILYEALQTYVPAGRLPENATVTDFFDSWASQPGYPLITVYRNEDTPSILLTQQAYTGESNDSPLTWWVPFNLVSANNPDFTSTVAESWIPQETRFLEFVPSTPIDNDDWILINKEQTGYYRVNYDANNWRLLSEGLQFGGGLTSIPPVTRAQLLDDSFVLSQDGFLSLFSALNMLNYIYDDFDYVPWVVADEIIGFLTTRLDGQEYFAQFEERIASFTLGPFLNLGYRVVEGESHVATKHRRIVLNWNCRMSSVYCETAVLEQLRDEINGIEDVHPELSDLVHCNGVRAGGVDEFNYFVAQETVQGINAISCSLDSDLIESQLSRVFSDETTLSTELREQFVRRLAQRGHFGYTQVLDYVYFNTDAVLESDITGVWLFELLANEFRVESQLPRLALLLARVNEEYNVYPLLQLAEENLDWLNQNGGAVREWLDADIHNNPSKFTPYNKA